MDVTHRLVTHLDSSSSTIGQVTSRPAHLLRANQNTVWLRTVEERMSGEGRRDVTLRKREQSSACLLCVCVCVCVPVLSLQLYKVGVSPGVHLQTPKSLIDSVSKNTVSITSGFMIVPRKLTVDEGDSVV